jgi:UDP-N-acetylglucosamine 4-epimerase
MVTMLQEITGGHDLEQIYTAERSGDVRHSRASIEKISQTLGYYPQTRFEKGLTLALQEYKERLPLKAK